MSLTSEVVQVGAVAAAIVEDLLHGSTNASLGPFSSSIDVSLSEIQAERFRQERKWGSQHHDPLKWFLILMEEVGEVAEEIQKAAPDSGTAASIVAMADALGRTARELLESS